MRTYFKQATKLFDNYKSTEKELNNDYMQARASGTYSSGYLKEMQSKNVEQLKTIHSSTTSTLMKIRDSFEAELNKKYDFTRSNINTHLSNLLNSGIDFSMQEWQELAIKSKDNITESRLIYDKAKKAGYELNNYIPKEKALESFDRYVTEVKTSMFGAPMFPPFLNMEQAEIYENSRFMQATESDMKIKPIPKTIEEEMLQDIKEQMEKNSHIHDDDAFMKGFTGEEPKVIELIGDDIYMMDDEAEVIEQKTI